MTNNGCVLHFSAIVNEKLEDLEDATEFGSGYQQFCDICQDKSQEKVVAVGYCDTEGCKKKYCEEHKKVRMLIA